VEMHWWMKVKYIILSSFFILGCSSEPSMDADTPTSAEIVEEQVGLEFLLADSSVITPEALQEVAYADELVLHPKGNTIAPSHVLFTAKKRGDFDALIKALNKRTEMVSQSGDFSVWTLENGQVWFYQHPSAGWVLEFRLK
jgi:hypothetical protein